MQIWNDLPDNQILKIDKEIMFADYSLKHSFLFLQTICKNNFRGMILKKFMVQADLTFFVFLHLEFFNESLLCYFRCDRLKYFNPF